MPAVAILHDPPTRLSVLFEEIKLLLRRNWWLIGLLFLVYFLSEWWDVFTDIPYLIRHGDRMELVLSNPGEPFWTDIMPLRIVKALLAGIWGYLIWRDSEPLRNPSYSGQPTGRLGFYANRIFIGAAVYTLAILAAYYCGIAFSTLLVTVNRLPLGFLPPLEQTVVFLSYLNIFLLSSLLVLTTRRPLSWLFVYTPAIVIVFFALRLFADVTPLHQLCYPVLPPWGLVGGLGVAIWDRAGEMVPPNMWAPLLWFAILAIAVGFASIRHRDA